MNIDIIAGARPNFMKIGPIIHAIKNYNEKNDDKIEYRLIHTGQHYDRIMSQSFFEQLNIPEPDINLGVGSGTQGQQTAKIMIEYERKLNDHLPDICLVVGDVTSTMACSIVAKKQGVRVAHVEGGIRSGDMSMPEEINRIVTDSISDYFFTTTEMASANLFKQGISHERVFFVGNTMIDSLLSNIERFSQPIFFNDFNLKQCSYLVATLHRPSNVDDVINLKKLLTTINDNCDRYKVIFPMHPRTRRTFDNIDTTFDNLIVIEPMEYLQFMYLVKNAKGVITDSGGITEETTVMGIPCMTLRDTTERPETVLVGTNEMVGTNPEDIIPYLNKLNKGSWKSGSIPKLWDGKAATRIVEILAKL